MRNFFLTLLFAFLAASAAFAQNEPRFYAEADRSEVALGSAVRVTFTLENGKGNSRIVPPDWSAAGLTLLGSSQSSSISIMNGETRSTASYTYTVAPSDTGTVTIPPASVKIGESELYSEPIVVRVLPNADGIQPVLPQRSPYQPPEEPKKKIKTIRM